MKKSNITGWKDVLSFTLIQTLKSKAYIITLMFLIIMSLVSMPIVASITSGGKKDTSGPSPVKKVYVNNETALPDMEFSELLADDNMKHIVFEPLLEDYDTVAERIEKDEQESVLFTLSDREGMFSLAFVKASKGSVKNGSLEALGAAVALQFEAFRINTLGITEEQTAMLGAEVKAAVTMSDINGEAIIKKDTSITGSEYWVIYGILFFIFMVNMMASTQIATSIVVEKSTRVVEYLLTSVRPLALMIGKILAMLTAVLIQMLSIVVALFVSNKVSAMLTTDGGDSILATYLPTDIFQNLNFVNILLCFIVIILGMFFYGTLAGMAGATVSRIEEMNEGMTIFSLVNVAGMYIGLAAANVLMAAGENAFVTFSLLFPLSSPFLLPGAILVGKASLPIALGSISLLLVFIVLLSRFVAKVYETLILHNGNTIKLKALFKISKATQKQRRNEVKYEK